MKIVKTLNPLDHPISYAQPLRLDHISAWVEHIPFAMFLVDLLRPRIFVELGTHTGVSYSAFCQAVKQLGINTHCYAVDTWQGDHQAGFYTSEVLEELRKHHDPIYGEFSELVQEKFDDAVKLFSDGSIDLLHIDGLHTYDAVKHDFETWLPKLSTRAVVLFHDTHVYEKDFGVWRIWAELKQQYPHFEFTHAHGLGILYVGADPIDFFDSLNDLVSLPEEDAKRVREFFHTLGSRFSSIIKKEREIIIKEREIAVKEHEKQTLLSKIVELNEQAQMLALQISSRDALITSLYTTLNEIYSSKGWRFVIRLRKLRNLQMRASQWAGGIVRSPFRPTDLLSFFRRAVHVLRSQSLKDLLLKILLRMIRTVKKPFLRSAPGLDWMTVQNDPYVPLSEADVDQTRVLVKAIAFYLPQFHPIPENDVWWEKGFTEWTNVTKARPNFEGHYQPHLPGELGFYDLRLQEVQKRQVELAKKYGIYGFCFYYYWFAGKRLLERPLDQYLADPALDLPFCLCWANENWTRRWDGLDHEILIGQDHNEQEYLHFIQDIIPHFRDPRYIRVDGKPLLLVYRINLLPDPQKAARIWRDECRRSEIGEIYLAAVQSFGITEPTPYGFDAAVEFPPHYLAEASKHSLKITNPRFKGRIYDYTNAIRYMIQKKPESYTLFKTVMPSWDNTARRQDDSGIFINANPSTYKKWLTMVVAYTRKNLPPDKRFVFINAWNEWAEGTHLEPDRRYGYGYLQATADALQTGWKILFISHDANKGGAQAALLDTLEWFKSSTSLSVKILCLDAGVLLPSFKELADTIVLNELTGSFEEQRMQLLEFCGGMPDLIYGNTVVAGKAYSWLHTLGLPILTHAYEMEMSIQYYAADSIDNVLKYSTHYITPSQAVKDNLVKNHAVNSNKITVVYDAVSGQPVHEYDSGIEKKSARKKLGLDAEKTLIIGCGMGMPFRKGADLFIELGEILSQRGCSNFHLYWIGEFADAESDPRYGSWGDHRAKLAGKPLADFITILGFRENFLDYFEAADIFVLPSREDPFPLVAMEAAKCGLPLVCFADAGGTPELVEEDAGFVTPYLDLVGMAEAITQLIEDEGLRKRMGERAREKVLERHDINVRGRHIVDIIDKLLESE